MHKTTYQQAVEAAAPCAVNAFSPYAQPGQTAAAAAVHYIRKHRCTIANNSTLSTCRRFFTPSFLFFVGFQDPADQAAAMVKFFPWNEQDAMRKVYANAADILPKLYADFFGSALFTAYQHEIASRPPHMVLESTIGHHVAAYLERRGCIYEAYFTAPGCKCILYRGEDRHAAQDVYATYTRNLQEQD